ncbi:hypothetical protein AgCh_021722 [Apium graveolens]
MGIRVTRITNLKQILNRQFSLKNLDRITDVPKGCMAVYFGGNQRRRFVVPVSYINEPRFQNLLSQAEEEFGFSHPEDEHIDNSGERAAPSDGVPGPSMRGWGVAAGWAPAKQHRKGGLAPTAPPV